MFNRKSRFFKNYKRHGYISDDNLTLAHFRNECQDAVGIAKLTYFTNMGNKLNNPNISQKRYCKSINNVTSKYKSPKISPLYVNNLFVHCKFFSQQCKPVITDNVLPNFSYLTNGKNRTPIENKDSISLIWKLNPNNAIGSDGISGHVLLLYSVRIISGHMFLLYSVRIIFSNIFVVYCKLLVCHGFGIIFMPSFWPCQLFSRRRKNLKKKYGKAATMKGTEQNRRR